MINFSIVCGAMASSAVSSVLYLRAAAGNCAETRTSANIHCADATSFHECEFRYALPINLTINTSKQCPKSVTDCVATHSSRLKKLAPIICAEWLAEGHVILTR